MRDFQSLKQSAVISACTNQAVWYTYIYAGATHQNFLRSRPGENSTPDPVLLVLKQKAIQALIKATKAALEQGEITEWFLSALLTMASHGSGEIVSKDHTAPVQLRKPQISIPIAPLYDALQLAVEHRDALFQLLQRKGGIHAIKDTALRTATIRFGVYTCYRTLQRPPFERVQSLESLFALPAWPSNDLEELGLPCSIIGFFDILERSDEEPQVSLLTKIIQALALLTSDQSFILSAEARNSASKIYSELNQNFEPGSEAMHDPAMIGACKVRLIWARCIVMWELLSLPDLSQDILRPKGFPSSSLPYELCRLSCFMYFQMWIWVIAGANINMARQLVSRILPFLEASVVPSLNDNAVLCKMHPEFFLWVITLTIVMAYEDYDQTGDVSSVKSISPFLRYLIVKPFPEMWSDISIILERFLWSSTDCNPLGRDAWVFACSLL